MTLPLRVLGDRVLIKPDVEDHAVEQTAGGIYVAESLAAAVDGEDTATSYTSGVVVAIGNQDQPFDCRPYILRRLKEKSGMVRLLHLIAEIEALPAHKPSDLRVGDRVTFSWKSGQEVAIDGDVYIVMQEADVLAVLQESIAV